MNTLFKVLQVSYEKNGSNIQGTNTYFSYFNVTTLILHYICEASSYWSYDISW